MTEEPLDLERLRAFVRGELDDAARASVEALVDRRPDARRILGVLAREGGRATDRDPYVGALLGGRYRIERRLGAGGMGAVYAAEHELLGRKVALKLLHPELGDRAEVRRRFEHEARAAASIDHPNVVGALDVGRTPDGAPFVVLELLVGVDLERHLATRGALPILEARAIGAAIAEGLSAAHARGIVHRDLKPANVFLAQPDPRRPPVPKILDFGISKLHDGLGTATGAFMGTPAYMAPEQLRDASSVDPRADLYALGVVLFRMLTGAMPHPHGSLGELLAAHDREPPSPRALRPELSPELDALVRRCLAPRREERPDDAASVAQALAPATRPPSALPPAPERRLVMALFASISLDRRTVEDAGGRVVRDDADGSLAIFGESAWTGELHDAALRVALALDAPDALFVVGAARLDRARLDRTRDVEGRLFEGSVVDGRVAEGKVAEGTVLEGDRIEGDVVETFAKARRRGARGVLVSPELRSAFPSVALEELAPGLHRVASALASSEATFVGRHLERARIRDAFERVVDERAPAALVLEGPPGVGKSRLVRQVSRELASSERSDARARVLVARARLDRLEESELLRGWLEDADLDDLSEELGRRGLSEHEPSLRLLVGQSSSAAATRHDVQLVADRVRLSALALLSAFATERPLVLVAEDARSAGSSAIALLERILERAGPILVLVVSRLPLALAGPDVEVVQLRGLRRREVAELASALGVALDEVAIAALHERTEGNPFFVEQLVRGPTDSLPASVEAAVQARLDALPSDERELLARASIVGDAFSNEDLVALGVEAPEARLASLRKKELVVRVHGSGATRHRIGSELVETTAYRALPPELRRELHLAFAHHLASARRSSSPDGAAASAQGPDAARASHTSGDVARHFDRAGATEAGAWHERAAEEAARVGDGAAVIAHAERARALGFFGADRRLAEAYELAGRLDDEARVIDESPVTPESLARSAVNRWRRGHVEDALALFARAEAEGSSANATERASVLGRHAVALIYAGRLDDARRRLDEAERLVLVRAPELRAEAAIWRAQLAAAAGDLGDRRNAYWAAVELYGERGDRRRRAQAAVNLADVYNRLGAYDEAETALRDALDDCAALGLSHAAAYAHANLAYAHLRRARFEDAERALVAAASLAASIGDRRLDDVLALYRLRVAAARGNDVRDEAAALGTALEDSSLALAALAFTCAAASALTHADSGAHSDAHSDARGPDALAWAERASRHLASLGTLEEDEAEVALVHARALDALGRTDEARDIRSLARATLLAAARRIADPEWRERWLRDVPAHRELLATI